MQNPTISIALPALNSESTLQDAVLSILHQSYEHWELLIVDDGSSDRTIAAAKRFTDPRIRLFSNGVHRGLSAQLNLAVKIARGRYIARMDADDIAYPDRLKRQLEFLEAHPHVDLVGAAVMLFRSSGVAGGVRRYPPGHEEICARPWLRMPVTHSTWMGRLDWFRRNPYRVDVTRAQDWELLRRTFRDSRFANIQDALSGVREDSISLRKQLTARRNICALALEFARQDRDLVTAGRTIAAELPRAAADVLAIGSGLGLALLPRRAQPATPVEIEEWNTVWETIQSACNTNHVR